MKLGVIIPRSSIDRFRKLSHPSRIVAFYLLLVLAYAIIVWERHTPSALLKTLQILLLLASLAVAWTNFWQEGRSLRRGAPFFLIATFLMFSVRSLWESPYFGTEHVAVILVAIAAIVYQLRDVLVLVGLLTLLELATADTMSGGSLRILFYGPILVLIAFLVSRITGGQRRKIAALREELSLARSAPLAFSWEKENEQAPLALSESAGSQSDIESLEASLQALLQRIKDYFCAYSVLLYQLCSKNTLALRHWVSDSQEVRGESLLEIDTTQFGRIMARGISCNWNFEDPDASVSAKDIPYYGSWQPVRHLACAPLEIQHRKLGLLVVDRTIPRPFTDLELVHLETFGIQLVEMIEMGRRYLEQVDRSMEYRLFYRAMSELSRSLAIHEVLEALTRISQEIVSATHRIVVLTDESGLSYEIAEAHGVERLKGLKVRSQGRTWISWILNSDSGPLLLKDIRQHGSKMHIVSTSEGSLPVRSVLIIPLVSKDRKIGVLLLGSIRPPYFQNWHLRVLTTICQQAATNIENSLLHRRVETEALTDGLTRLRNHRYFQERLKTEFSRSRRTGASLSLLMIDIDHFKKVNDTYGHRIGDIILQQIADILKATMRTEDSLARYGGEEFVIILTGSDRRGAFRMAERSRIAVERVTFCVEEHTITLSVSMGTATFPGDAAEPWQLIERADRALYAAKEQGRNRVIQYHSIAQRAAPIESMRR